MKRRTFIGTASAAAIGFALLRERALAAGAIPGEIAAKRLDGSAIALRGADLEDLRASLRGPLLLPGDDDYDSARRIWNAVFDRKPALIARCAGAADIARALQFASANSLLTAVRGGGHSLSGQSVCDGGIMIDLSLMKSVHVDPHLKTARIEPGVLLGDLDREALAFGLITTAGTVSHTGAAGLTLGGGTGRLARRFGLAIDNVTALDIVTPDGKLQAANGTENEDLFWGSRGGGGNFGVVSSLEYGLHPFDGKVYGGQIYFPMTRARELLDLYANLQPRLPDEMWCELVLLQTLTGDRLVKVDVCHSGTVAEGERLLKPLLDFGTPLSGSLGPTHYRALQTHDDQRARHGLRHYHKGGFLREFKPGLFEAMIAQFADPDAGHLQLTLVPSGGGAVARVARNATAFWHRDLRHNMNVATHWENPADGERHTARARAAYRELERFTHGFYGNSMTDRGANDMRSLYGDNFDRMVAIKRRRDPNNQLRLNANVAPAKA
jgi:FAD/FMN-containing dehydrogenase